MYPVQQRNERDVSYWRRRGQDFSVLLDYADSREPRGSSFAKPEGMRKGHEMPTKDRQHEGAWWEESTCLKERGVMQEKWRIAGDRKWQSLGTEEWKPAVGLGRQLSDGDGDNWAHNQRCLKPGEGVSVHQKAKGKSQSLPRVLSPESLQYVEMPLSSQDMYSSQRMNGKISQGPYNKYHEETSGKELCPEIVRPGGHPALLPKPRFSRPLKPPSYEAHQQTRGSSEMIAGVQEPKSKDKISYFAKSGETRQDIFAYEPAGSNLEPPVYIPPPSYKKPQLQKVSERGFNEVTKYKFKREVQQVPESTDTGKWFSRQTGSSWVEYQKGRGVPCRKQMYPGYIGDHLGCVQYIPFDDPRVKHIQGDPCGKSLTDSDKLKNISKEMPSATALEQSTHDSAFSPPQGLSFDMDASKRSLHEHDNGSRWYSGLHKGSDNSIASDQSCIKYQKDQSHMAYQFRTSRQNSKLDQGLSETVTQVKKFEPGTEAESKRNSKRKLNETIFCLVSVPVHLQPNGESSDQNNNEKIPSAAEGSIDKNVGNLQHQSLLSTSSTDLELQALTGGMMNNKGVKKMHPRKDQDELRPLQPNKHKELQYSGSWPGDQYRDQETQTSFPEPSKGAPQGFPNNQAQSQSHPAPDNTAEVNLGADCNNRYGYPMKGQKYLNPSSNSAFSRTTTFSNQVNKSTAQQIQPSGNLEEKNHISTRTCESKSSASNGKEVFGQFLLKPVSRRPWDAIEELESFNKELQEQFGKQPSVDNSVDDIDTDYRDILDFNMAGPGAENAKTHISDQIQGRPSLAEAPHCQTNKLKTAFENWTAAVDLEYRDISAFSRPPPKTVSFARPAKEEVPMLSQKTVCDRRIFKQDMSRPKEPRGGVSSAFQSSSAEALGVPRQMMQDASTHTNPPDYEDICYALQLSRESMGINRAAKHDDHIPTEPKSVDFKSVSQTSVQTVGFSRQKQEGLCFKTEPDRKIKKENLVPKGSAENSPNIVNLKGPNNKFHCSGGLHNSVNDKSSEDRDTNGGLFMTDDDAETCSWMKQPSLTELHLETLQVNEKARGLQGEDLNNLFEIKSADGIPENESFEQRAARILGIDVPAESLGVAEHNGSKHVAEQKGATEIQPLMQGNAFSGEALEHSANGDVLHMRRQYQEQSAKPRLVRRQDREKELTETRRETSTGNLLENNCVEKKNDLSVQGLLPGNLLPVSAEEKMGQPLGSDKKSRSTSRMIEALQDKLASSPSRTVMERIVRMKEVDSVSRMRRLSIKSSDSGDEAEAERMTRPWQDAEEIHTTRQETRSGAVTKREITLAQDLRVSSKGMALQDVEVLSFSDSYDPSRVERV
ncbi:junctional cadherin 5-associated protein isoform X2 [Amia ocellicauda]